MNHAQHNQIIAFIWGIADDVLRDVFVRGKYRDVILPMTVLRRLDALLEPTKGRVLETYKFLEENQIEDRSALLSKENGSGLAFYNTSQWTLKGLLQVTNQDELGRCFVEYLNGFSPNVGEIIDKFHLRDQLKTLVADKSLHLLISRFTEGRLNLSPDPVLSPLGAEIHPGLDNRGMGYVFEELLRRFNEENNEEAGEHFTPRDIIELMTHLVFDPIAPRLTDNTPYRIYDDACGSGGMLTIAREKMEQVGERSGKTFHIELYGQEVNPETFAICQSDMLISGQNADGIVNDSTLSRDGHIGKTFDFMLANPPYGKSWKKDQEAITDGKTKEVYDPRFSQLLPNGERLRLVPASSDGQLLFTVSMLTKMKTQTPLGSRVAVVHNGSALFTGDAGAGESNIRRWILENDWLEAIVALPLRMFYNTGIATYIWVLCNKKEARRRGRVQLIDATQWLHKMRKNLGQKGHELGTGEIRRILEAHAAFEDNATSKIFDNSDFGYRKICVERPLRLRADLTRCSGEATFDAVLDKLRAGLGDVCADYNAVRRAVSELKVKWRDKDWKTFRAVCCERDDEAAPVANDKGGYECDAAKRDWENVPLKEDVGEYFRREVLPHAPDAWIDEAQTRIGYEISFTRYFYTYTPLRPLEAIAADIYALEAETEGLLHRVIADVLPQQAKAEVAR